MPAMAETWAMPWPMVPPPMMVARLMVHCVMFGLSGMAAEGDFRLEVSRVFTSLLRSDIQLYTSHSASQPDVLKQMNYTPVRSDSAFAHFVILLCTKIHDVAAACNYLDTWLMRLYDLQSALRAFTSKSLLVFGASLFLKLGLYEDAVDLALEFDITLAKDLANLFEVPQALRK